MSEQILFTVVPEAPYDGHELGRITMLRGRRYISFSKKKRWRKNYFYPIRTTYARYLFQVHLWGQKREWIPDDMDVDHINNDRLDDRIENLQLLTPLENIKKRDQAVYAGRFLPAATMGRIKGLLDAHTPWRTVEDLCDLTPGHLRYLVTNFFPEHSIVNDFVYNVETVRSMLEYHRTQRSIADEFGVDQATISRLIDEHLPEFSKRDIIDRHVSAIKLLMLAGKTRKETAAEIGISSDMVGYYARTYLKGLLKQQRRERERIETRLVRQIEELLSEDMTQAEIAVALHLHPAKVQKLIVKHFPEHTRPMVVESKKALILKLFDSGCTQMEIKDLARVTASTVQMVIEQERPNQSAKTKRDQKKEQVGNLLRQGLSQKEVLTIVGGTQGALAEYMSKHFPEYTRAGRETTPQDLQTEVTAVADEICTRLAA